MSLLGKTIDDSTQKNLSYKIDRLGLRLFFYICFVISTLFLLTGILGKFMWSDASDLVNKGLSILLGLGATGFCVSVLLAEYKFIIEDWVLNDVFSLMRAFCSRDRVGRRLPGLMLRTGLGWVRNLDKILIDQPDDLLIALAATRKMSGYHDVIIKAISNSPQGVFNAAESSILAGHPACTTLTKIDFTNSDNTNIRHFSAGLLPKTLWSRAIITLLQSKYTEGRIVAVQCTMIRRHILIRVCRRDSEQSVREAAWKQIKSRLTRAEAAALSRSKYADVRALVIQMRLLSRRHLKRMCRKDKEQSIRGFAWEQIKSKLTRVEAVVLSRSKYADVRALIARSGLLSRRHLRKIYCKDKDQSVRGVAWEQIKNRLTKTELVALSNSKYADVRLVVAAHPKTPKKILIKLAKDTALDVRKEALIQTLMDATPKYLEELSTDHDEATRLAVASHPSTSKEILLKLTADRAQRIREKALLRVLEYAAIEEIQHFIESNFDDVKKMTIKWIGEKRDKKGADMILPHLKNLSLQHNVIEAFLNIKGNSALPKIIEILGLNTTLRITEKKRLVSYFNDQEPKKIVEMLSIVNKESKQINVGTRTVENESYDSYGGTSTYTTTEDVFRTFSYFSPEIVSKILQILKELEDIKEYAVLSLLADQKAGILQLIKLGLENQDWQNSLFGPILESISKIQESDFSVSSNDGIIRQLV